MKCYKNITKIFFVIKKCYLLFVFLALSFSMGCQKRLSESVKLLKDKCHVPSTGVTTDIARSVCQSMKHLRVWLLPPYGRLVHRWFPSEFFQPITIYSSLQGHGIIE